MIVRWFAICAFLTLIAACEIMPSQRVSLAGEMEMALSLEEIAPGIYVHKSYEVVPPWGPIMAQGLVVDTDDGVLLVDTAWTIDQTRSLLTLINNKLGTLPRFAVITHAHNDKLGGIDVLHDENIPTLAHPLVIEAAIARGYTPPKTSITDNAAFQNITKYDTIIFAYPGYGHDIGNSALYVSSADVLYGGCLIRPGNSINLGFTGDGDIKGWANAAQALKDRFTDVKIVVPSHGAPGGPGLLDHTIALAERTGR